MGYKKGEINLITNEVLREFMEVEAGFGKEVSEEEKRAIKFAVASTLEKSLPF